MTRVDGHARATVAASDRGLAYGDGVFRTLRTRERAPRWWPDHYAKLAADCAALGIACPAADLLEAEIGAVAEAGEGVAKLIVTRGAGARGYAAPAGGSPTRIVSAGPVPPHALPSEVRVRRCALRLARQPRLAGIKHLNRLENVLARAEWSDPAIAEGLLGDADGALVSGVSSNVFVVLDGELVTPALDACGVAGVARARILRAAAILGETVRVARVDFAALARADAVLLSNSVVGVWHVAELDGRTLPDLGWRARLAAWLEHEPS